MSELPTHDPFAPLGETTIAPARPNNVIDIQEKLAKLRELRNEANEPTPVVEAAGEPTHEVDVMFDDSPAVEISINDEPLHDAESQQRLAETRVALARKSINGMLGGSWFTRSEAPRHRKEKERRFGFGRFRSSGGKHKLVPGKHRAS
jgi:hypothetical protein